MIEVLEEADRVLRVPGSQILPHPWKELIASLGFMHGELRGTFDISHGGRRQMRILEKIVLALASGRYPTREQKEKQLPQYRQIRQCKNNLTKYE
ncbi:hypothetical protein RJZ57_006587 [Blastomyces gilchristii]